jgi:hypothetical protein
MSVEGSEKGTKQVKDKVKEFWDLNRELKRTTGRGLPKAIFHFAKSYDFVTVKLVREALASEKFPFRKQGALTKDEEKSYYNNLYNLLIELALPEDVLKELSGESFDGGGDNSSSLADTKASELPKDGALFEFMGIKAKMPKLMGRSFPAPSGYIRLTVNVPKELHRSLKLEALHKGKTITEVIVGFVEEWVKNSKKDNESLF